MTTPVAAAPETGLAGTAVGVDAGGSGSRVVVLEDGRLAEQWSGAPFNATIDGDVVAWLLPLLRPLGARLDGATVGVAAAGATHAGAAALTARLQRHLHAAVSVMSDLEAAWWAAADGDPATVVIAGTGSAAVSGTVDGLVSAGGHGYLLGDEGSAYWLGRSALALALRLRDRQRGAGSDAGGRAADDAAFVEQLQAAAGLDLDALAAVVRRDPGDRQVLARLAPWLSRSDSAHARRLCARAASELIDLVDRGAAGRTYPVHYWGGVFTAPAVRAAFVSATAARPLPRPPAAGAALAAVATRTGRWRPT